jgi:hypothetical protein
MNQEATVKWLGHNDANGPHVNELRANPKLRNTFQPGFADLIAATDDACAERFGTRLLAAYVAGSVALGEAWPGASDLDWFVFIRAELTAADQTWRRRMQVRLAAHFPVVSEVHLNVYPLARLASEPYWRFIMRYNAVRIRGTDVVARLDRRGYRTPRPNRALAKQRLPFVRKCLAEAMSGRRVSALAELPEDQALATRKLVRNFVLVEGAHLLMALRVFRSFRKTEVLSALRISAPEWRSLYELAERILNDPNSVDVERQQFMQEVRPFVEWIIGAIERS